MANPFRNFVLHWHRLRRARSVLVDGIRVRCGPHDVPRQVQSGLFKGTYEDGERALLKKTVQAGERVLEIGGGIGVVGLLAAKLVGPKGRVLSYEANPAQRGIIEANYALNRGSGNPVPDLRMKAITTDGAPVSFHISDNVISSSLVARKEATRAVEVESDALAAVLQELQPQVIVMDVEGAEIELLQDIDLSGPRALIIELHPHIVGQAACDALLESLRGQGFRLTTKARSNVLLTRERG